MTNPCICGHEKEKHYRHFIGTCEMCPCPSFRPAEPESPQKKEGYGIHGLQCPDCNGGPCECLCPKCRPAEKINDDVAEIIGDGTAEEIDSKVFGVSPTAEPSPEKPTMTLEQKIQAIREKCIAANDNKYPLTLIPHIGTRQWHGTGPHLGLADVLLAITAIMPTAKIDDKALLEFIFIRWDLRADDLNLQTPETINFLYELLK